MYGFGSYDAYGRRPPDVQVLSSDRPFPDRKSAETGSPIAETCSHTSNAESTQSDPADTVWPVRRTILYHSHMRTEGNRIKSLFVLVSPQIHVENALVDILQSYCRQTWEKDPFEVHALLHQYCLGNWWIQARHFSTVLRNNVRTLILPGPCCTPTKS
jgi:hypothetical protein